MSRIVLLIPFLLWMAWPPGDPARSVGTTAGLVLFLGFYTALPLLMGLWARLVVRRSGPRTLHPRVSRFNRGMFAARMLVPAWFAIGLSLLGWRDVVGNRFGLDDLIFELPSLMLGTAPCFLAWMGLWWAQWPTERALREQSILLRFDRNLPVQAPPSFAQYFWTNFRLQVLFTVVPILLILTVVDLSTVAVRPLVGQWDDATVGWFQQALILTAAAGIYIVSPDLLRRILRTVPLEDSPLRRRLLALAARHNLRVRDVLLWQTHHNICNAAVMGIVGRFRYVLLTDLLIETMSDEQIEAVFAHEIGHVVHRHMQWYVLIIGTLVLVTSGLGHLIDQWVGPTARLHWAGLSLDVWLTLAAAMTFLLAFGFLSRRFERQADVFAARTIQEERRLSSALAPAQMLTVPHDATLAAPDMNQDRSGSMRPTDRTVVGPYGASVFASALHRVAAINNIPLRPRSWSGGSTFEWLVFMTDRTIENANHFLHGSITRRTDYLRTLAEDPQHTRHFDRFMSRLYRGLLILFACSLLFAFYPQLLR